MFEMATDWNKVSKITLDANERIMVIFFNLNIQSDQPMRDEYLVACHLVDQSEEVYGHLSRGVRRGQESGPSRRKLNFNVSYSKLNECAPAQLLVFVRLSNNFAKNRQPKECSNPTGNKVETLRVHLKLSPFKI